MVQEQRRDKVQVPLHDTRARTDMDSAISTPHRAPTHTRAKRREVQQNAQMHEKVEAQYKARKMRVIKLKEEVFTNHRVLL